MNGLFSRATLLAFLASTLCACGAPANTAAVPATVLPASSVRLHSLGFRAATARELAALPHLRHAKSVAVLPASVDLSPKMPSVGDQGNEGSCVAWASGYAMRGYEARNDVWASIDPKSTSPAYNISPAFVYNVLDGGVDDGLTIPAALDLMKTTGAATLADMPYVAGQFLTQPSSAAFADAANYKLASYAAIAPNDLTTMKSELAQGVPVILAISVYMNFEALGNGQTYSSVSGPYLGGHAITIVGYSDAAQAVEIINSWGTYWGTNGYGWISYDALPQIAREAYAAVDGSVTPVPSPSPTITPSPVPTATAIPTAVPTTAPTAAPSPTVTPTVKPSPTATPTAAPTVVPTAKPTPKPSPTTVPTVKPSPMPSPKPSPTATPSVKPAPTPTPKASPTAVPTVKPTVAPAVKPAATPSPKPKAAASATPAPKSSAKPKSKVRARPTVKKPSPKPSAAP